MPDLATLDLHELDAGDLEAIDGGFWKELLVGAAAVAGFALGLLYIDALF